MLYKEYRNELPLNTIKTWGSRLMADLPWEYSGWAGSPKEPFRHWACYPNYEGEIKRIWETLNYSLKEDGFDLKPYKVIANLFSHGDSSWLHTDRDSDTAWTVILYLNDFWDRNWHGGTILYNKDGVEKYFEPEPGKFVIFKSNLIHGATPVSREAPYPRFGLTFQSDSTLHRFSEDSVSSISTS